MKKGLSLAVLVSFFLVISVYVSFADCYDEYDTCNGQCGTERVDCWDRCDSDQGACDAPISAEFDACVEPCPNANHYPTCVNNCYAISTPRHGRCSTEHDACEDNCDANAKTCDESCESLRTGCEEGIPSEEEEYEEEEEEIPPEEEEQPEIEEPEEETPEEITTEEEEEQEMETAEEVLLESVAAASRKRKEEIQSIQNYYARPQATFPGMTECEECAKKKFEETVPLQIQVGKARFAYEDALKEGASQEELAKLKNNYDNSAKDLKKQLQDVLNEDRGNADASFVLGTLSKWDGNNRQSYEYNRDALASLQTRNIFEYNRRLEMFSPAMQMELLQALAPKEKLITLPTKETSPALKVLDDGYQKLVLQVNKQKRQFAEEVEKIARGLSLSKYMSKKLQEFSGLSIEEK